MNEVVDNVHCNNCNTDLKVRLGNNTCPKCRKEGSLQWKENEPKEVFGTPYFVKSKLQHENYPGRT